MNNYPEDIWKSVKTGIFPIVTGEEEKRLKIAFLQGMHSGRELVLQSSTLGKDTCYKFNTELAKQVTSSLVQLSYRPGSIKVSNIRFLQFGA